MNLIKSIKNKIRHVKTNEVLYWLAGINSKVLNRPEFDSSEERIKYQAMGAIVLIPVILALVSGGYAMFMFSGSYLVGGIAAIAYSFTILTLDRFLVIGIKKEYKIEAIDTESAIQAIDSNSTKTKKIIATTIVFCVRVGLSGLISILISKPLEVYLFRFEIIEEIAPKLEEKEEKRIATLEDKRKENEKFYEGQLEIARKSRTNLEGLIIKNPAQAKQWEGILKERQDEIGRLEKDRDVKSNEIDDKKQDAKDRIISINNAKKRHDIFSIREVVGFFDQVVTLESLGYDHESGSMTIIGYANTLIVVFLILLDSAPVIVKSFVIKYGAYNAVIDRDESKIKKYHKNMERLDGNKIDEDIRLIKSTREEMNKRITEKLQEFTSTLSGKIDEKINQDINYKAANIAEDIMKQLELLGIEQTTMSTNNQSLIDFFKVLTHEFQSHNNIDLNLAANNYIRQEESRITKKMMKTISEQIDQISTNDPTIKKKINDKAKLMITEQLSNLDKNNQANNASVQPKYQENGKQL